jgi:hypothetical protein
MGICEMCPSVQFDTYAIAIAENSKDLQNMSNFSSTKSFMESLKVE